MTVLERALRRVRTFVATDAEALDMLMTTVGGKQLSNKELAALFRAEAEHGLQNYLRRRTRKAKKSGE